MAAERNEEDVASANLANESGNDSLLLSISDKFEHASEWIVDSVCSFHMCPNKE
ncbi:hypothetical protein Golax_010838, partial [Gossypium laxum]|nr:hypothetical protein [Gossypium laxum]